MAENKFLKRVSTVLITSMLTAFDMTCTFLNVRTVMGPVLHANLKKIQNALGNVIMDALEVM